MLKNSDKYVQALRKHAQEITPAKQEPAVYASPINTRSGMMMFNLVVAALLVLLFCLNIMLAVFLKGSRLDKNSLTQRLDSIEDTLKANGEEVKQLSSRIGDIKKIIKEINESNAAQAAAIENLTKAKNNIFTRVTELEADTEKLKNK